MISSIAVILLKFLSQAAPLINLFIYRSELAWSLLLLGPEIIWTPVFENVLFDL